MRIPKRNVLGICVGILIGCCIYGINSGWTKQVNPQKRDFITSAPNIVSCVGKVKVTKAEIIDAGKENARLEVAVENVSDVGIIAITMTTKKGPEAFTVSLRTSFEEGAKQTVVIPPHKTGVLRMAVANIYKDEAVEIGSAMYADGSEEGCPQALEDLHDIKTHEQRSEKKEVVPR